MDKADAVQEALLKEARAWEESVFAAAAAAGIPTTQPYSPKFIAYARAHRAAWIRHAPFHYTLISRPGLAGIYTPEGN